jgi:hypothetical protein
MEKIKFTKFLITHNRNNCFLLAEGSEVNLNFAFNFDLRPKASYLERWCIMQILIGSSSCNTLCDQSSWLVSSSKIQFYFIVYCYVPSVYRCRYMAGLPDGIVSYQQCQFWHIFEGLGMKSLDVFYSHLVLLV